ncbi:MAG: AAA family ATPase, partial [Myxococcota bacterium]
GKPLSAYIGVGRLGYLSTGSLWTHQLSSTLEDNDAPLPNPDAIREAPSTDHGVPREVVLGWLYQVGQALSYIHSQGVVHADLKPDNILITPDDKAILVDFGLATSFGSRVEVDTLRHAGLRAGSLSYISPEQCKGEPLDPRADLYALGCIVFECLSGRPPFLIEGTGVIRNTMLEKHIHERPPTLEQLGVEVPEGWDAVVEVMEGLLAKSPTARPGHAQVMLRTLETVGVGRYDRTREGRPYLNKPALIGRQRLLGQLTEALQQTQHDGTGQLILLGGESGVGKTRLAFELIREARQRQIQVWVGYSSSMLGSGLRSSDHMEDRPLGLFVPVLRALADHCVQAGPQTTAAILEPADVAILVPYAPFLRQLPGVEHTPLAELPAESARLRLFACLVRVLERACVERPALFVFDDVQWADELSWAALEFMAHHLASSPWLVVGTYRADEVSELLQELMDEVPCQALSVGRLSSVQVAQLAGQMLGTTPNPVLVEALTAKSGGNPFFVAEYLHTIVESDTLRLGSQGRWTLLDEDTLGERLAQLPDPGSIQVLLGQRLDRLGGHERWICEAAAVLGKRCHPTVLREVSELARFPFQNALDMLVQLHILEYGDGFQQEQLQFVHDRLHETSYTRAHGDRLKVLHRKAASVLESQESFDPGTTALHWARGGEPDQARSRYVEAARQDAERWAVEEARRHLRAALELDVANHPDDDIVLRMELLRLTALLGEHQQVVTDAQGVLERLAERDAEAMLPWRGQAHLDAATALEALIRPEEAQHHVEAAQAVIARLGVDRHLEGRLAFVQGRIGFAMNAPGVEFDALMALFQRSADLHAQAGETQLQARSLLEMSDRWANHGDYDLSTACCRKAQHLFRDIHDLHGEALLWTRMGKNYNFTSQHDEAQACYVRALELHRQTGNGPGEAKTLWRLSQLL